MWTARAIAANQEANAVVREDVPAKGWTAGSPTGWSLESFAREQLRGLVRQVFSVTAARPVRQMVFSPVEPEVEVASLCLQVAQTLSEERLKDVALATDARFPADVCTLLEPGRYVLFLGRFSPEKGCHVLIEAFEGIETDVKLVLAGGASYCDAYARDVLSHAGDRIRIFSWVSGQDLDELLTNAMLFVLPSEMEGLSLALLDAMGAGICVLASDIAENREAVEGAGFTFRCGNVADLADRLRFLIDSAAIREAAGKAARKRVEDQYNWNKLAKDVERVYFDVLGLQAPESAQKKSNQKIVVAEPESKERLVG